MLYHRETMGARFSSHIRTVPTAMLPGAPDSMAAHEELLLKNQPPPDRARAMNSAIPFMTDKGLSALPFHFAGSPADRDRARYCLAAAALYEAGGDDAEGQTAVMQVVLNRVRHPAFAPSVCGVVFQGQERRTGCQFTFTCDGSLARQFTPDRWRTALARADAALAGAVDKQVGLATHYHTDWVYPYWSPSLDKLQRVGTHLFFRWRGYWGTRGAFNTRPSGSEPQIAKLAAFLPHHQAAPGTALLAVDKDVADAVLADEASVNLPPRTALDPTRFGSSIAAMEGAQIMVSHPDGGGFLLAIPTVMSKTQFSKLAKILCGMDDVCRVQGWREPGQVPRGYPLPPSAKRTIAFEYFRDLKTGNEYMFGV